LANPYNSSDNIFLDYKLHAINFLFRAEEETVEEVEYTLFISSPTNDKAFDFINESEAVPI